MKKQKLMMLVLAAAAVTAMTACSGGGSAQGTSAVQETSAAETTAAETTAAETTVAETTAAESEAEEIKNENDPFGATEEKITVTIGRPTSAEADQMLSEYRWTYDDNAVINWYERRLNADIQFAEGGEDYDSQIRQAMETGGLPDVMQITSRELLAELVEKDLVADLTEVYDAYASDALKEVYGSYEEAGGGLKPATFDGKIMALPGTIYGSQLTSLVWFRQDWLEELGITLDEDGNGVISRDELEMVARAFKEQDPGGSGDPVGIANYAYMGDENRAIFTSFNSYPEKWFKAEDGTVYNGSTAPETKEALSYMHKLYEEGLLDPQFGTRTYEEITAMAESGQLGIFINTWATGSYVFKDGSLSCYMLGDENGQVTAPISNTFYGGFVAVRKDYEHPEAAIRLVNMQADVEYGARNTDENYWKTDYRNLKNNGKAEAIEPFTLHWYGNDDLEMKMYKSVRDYVDEVNEKAGGDVYGSLWEGYPGREQNVERFAMPATNGSMLWHYYVFVYPELGLTEDITFGEYYKWYVGADCLYKVKSSGSLKWADCLYIDLPEEMKAEETALSQFTEDVFVKIIRGELAVDEFDSYVNDWKDGKGGAAYCESLAGLLQE